MADHPDDEFAKHLKKEDPIKIAELRTTDEIERLIAAEELLEKRYNRRRRSARMALLAQALVGYVALAGFFANAYQNWNNKKQAEERARTDEERWAKEFKRAQDADKYRAFFETSALATDPTNPDKRLVGYALLKEFVDDNTYNSKATFMLEESLALELRGDTGPGLDEQHHAAVVAILQALSHTSDCLGLARAAHTVDKLATRHAQHHDVDESKEVLALYLVRLVGRAAQVCGPKELLEVRRPLRELVLRQPDMAGLSGKPTLPEVDKRMHEILTQRCQEEIEGGLNDCAGVAAAWAKMCETAEKEKLDDAKALCANTR